MGSASSVDASNSASENQDLDRGTRPSDTLPLSTNPEDGISHLSRSSNSLPGNPVGLEHSQGSVAHSRASLSRSLDSISRNQGNLSRSISHGQRDPSGSQGNISQSRENLSRNASNSRRNLSRSISQGNTSHSQGSSSHSQRNTLPYSQRNTTSRLPTIVSPTLSINEDQQAMVRECLSTLESGLVDSGVHLNVDYVLPHVEVVTRTDDIIVEGEALLKDNGLYIVQEGQLDLYAADGQTVSQRLQAGDFFGELSSLFRVPNSAVVNVVTSEVILLHIPPDSIRECVSIDKGGKGFSKEIMLKWSIKRSYLEPCELFGHGVLAQGVVANCLKASVLSKLTMEAVNFIAELATPILFEPGDVIYSPEEEAGFIFLILKGGIQLSSGSTVISNKNVKYSDEGYCLCCKEFFSGSKLLHEAKATTPLIVSPVSKEILLEMVNKFPNEKSKLKFLLNTYKRQR